MDYRIYFFDERGHIARAKPIDCESDGEALALFDGTPHGGATELWQRGRFLRRAEAPLQSGQGQDRS